MDVGLLKMERVSRGWTQQAAARRVGVSQSYLSMLESGRRAVPPRLARKLVHTYRLSPALLAHRESPALGVLPSTLARHIGALGYAPFAYLGRPRQRKNPAEILVAALSQPNLEARLIEALPWLLWRYPDIDMDWLVQQARIHNIQNRLGFVAHLAAAVARAKDDRAAEERLSHFQQRLDESRLARLDTLCEEKLTAAERRWLHENRSEQAKHWNLLTDWRPEFLRYARAA